MATNQRLLSGERTDVANAFSRQMEVLFVTSTCMSNKPHLHALPAAADMRFAAGKALLHEPLCGQEMGG
jgi:hypothetical protein